MPAAVDTTVRTHCPYCSLQCGTALTPAAGGQLEVWAGDLPTNRGGLCVKGWSAAELLDHPDRLTRPLVRDRRDEGFRTASGDDAVERIADGLTNEKAYQLGKFVRVALRSSAIDYNCRFCMSSAAAAAQQAFGLNRGMPFPLSDIAHAEAVLLVGSNPADTMPPGCSGSWPASSGARHTS